MRALLVALVLAAAPPPSAQKAKELAASRAWEDLYLAFASGEVKDVPDAQRRTISGALLKGCEALLGEDPVMAYSLGERAAVYDESAGALRCLARSARKTDQRASAEAALRKGMEKHPKDGAFPLELGRLLLEEQDAAGALAVLEKVPPRSREAAEAKRLVQQARAKTNEEGAARKEAERLEQLMNGKGGGRRPAGTELEVAPATGRGDKGETRSASLTYESGTDTGGMRTRSNSRFVIRYFNNQRDFGQRADYEGRVVAALDEAYDFTLREIGETRERPVDVILYTREEFSLHFGKQRAQMIAGLYSDDAIRINDAAEMSQETRATLVHEYVHAVLDSYTQGARDTLPVWLNEGLAEYVEWRYLGEESPPNRIVRNAMTSAAKAGKLPRLAEMADQSLIFSRNPSVAYATSAIAVRELVRRGGAERLITFIREVGGGRPIEEALRDHYGETLASLDEDVRAALQ
ncbi:peptidase MA family metallohydrolase [Pyxidicoccus sp. MSG2]|uniref:peptidase MA family metallohydrolase n=1 Tax=Pyxidicoccus sp. MSG2 TaxID=2996790 RepID=UPI0022720258|nr:tetratricopeptide repeat protein [Pyxidicoccus sp. MSG2]MCY1020550.1 peptidase MA family metallohydrolase [Pyxidicoccus sp. MSG2]